MKLRTNWQLPEGRWKTITEEKWERFSGTSIKNTWTKPKGHRIEGERWGWRGKGENGDNCTRTTVKKLKLKLKWRKRNREIMVLSRPEWQGNMTLSHQWYWLITMDHKGWMIKIKIQISKIISKTQSKEKPKTNQCHYSSDCRFLNIKHNNYSTKKVMNT